MKPIVVVGSINLDLVVQTDRSPAAGETVLGRGFAMHHGGKGANQAVAAARLGAPTAHIGCVGGDDFGTHLLDGLRSAGVDTGMVSRKLGPSGVAVIEVDAQQENRIVVVAGANDALTPAMLEAYEERIAAAGMVLTQLETPIPTVTALASLCTRHGVPLMLDPAPARPLSRDLLAQTCWLTPNLGEACTLLGRPALQACTAEKAIGLGQALLQLGADNVLLKLGSAGLLAVSADSAPVFVPALPVAVVDTTAAGDATNAAFACALLQGLSLQRAMRFAAAAGALTVTKHGAQPALPTRIEVDEFLEGKDSAAHA